MRDKERERAMVQKAAGDAAKQLLAKPGVVITPDNDQACLTPLRFLH